MVISKDQFLILSLVEAIYVVYMLNYFKTHYSLAHPLTYFENEFLFHPIGKSETPICQICPLGNWGSYLIAFFIVIRAILYNYVNNKSVKNNTRFASLLVLTLVFVLSLLNFNAVVYLVPYFAIEIFLIMNYF
jgi:hypothetical protein